jgi:hydantoinase/carbamoylase family amidase
VPLDPSRTLAELDELAELTGTRAGAQRMCWTEPWAAARAWLDEKLRALPVELETDPAGNRWATLAGASDRALVIGSHLDSVPDGGRLDGCLGVLAGLEVLRRVAEEGTPRATVRLVDWADEEGARFGPGVFGSSAASGSLRVNELRPLRDAAGRALPDVLREHGVELDSAPDARAQLASAAAYLELHIEQGPLLEELGLPLGAVLGTVGLHRTTIRFSGQSSHAGTTPMQLRRDPVCAAARLTLAVRAIARAAGGVGTVGRFVVDPGIPTAVGSTCLVSIDQRHLRQESLDGMARDALTAAEAIASEEGVEVERRILAEVPPVAFDDDLVALAGEAVSEVAGRCHALPSGALHDATEVARAGVPTAMVFVQSLAGLSHAKEEDSRREHLELGVRALDALVDRVLARLGGKVH